MEKDELDPGLVVFSIIKEMFSQVGPQHVLPARWWFPKLVYNNPQVTGRKRAAFDISTCGSDF